MYLTPEQLLNRIGQYELTAYVSGRLGAQVTPDVLQKVITKADLSGSQPDAVDAAEQALTIIQTEITTATRTIESYILQKLDRPMTQAEIDISVLPDIAYKLTKYGLQLTATEQTANDYRMAMGQLRDIAKGTVALTQTEKPATTGRMVTAHSHSQFNWGAFGK